MTCEQITKPWLAVLPALGLIVAFGPVPLSAAPPQGPDRGPGHALHLASLGRPGPKPRPKARPKVIPRVRPTARLPIGPRPTHPRVVPRYVPRPIVRPRVPVVVHRGPYVVGQAAPLAVVTEADLAAVPAKTFTGAKAYQVVSLRGDYTVGLLIDGKETPVRLLGVEPPLVAPSEGQPGVLSKDAVRFVRNLLAGEMVYVDTDPQLASTDAEGIRVAYLHRAPDGLLLNLEIIRQGYGLAAEGYSFQYRDVFASYQTWAQTVGKGVWRPEE